MLDAKLDTKLSEDARIARPMPADDAFHLLIVDDDRRIRDLLSRFLTEHGYRVTTAESAADARARLAGLTFDLLILDVMMPGESGFELARAVREGSGVPIMMLTARSETGDRIEGLEIGADDYLGKPFNPRELLARIRALLRRASGPLSAGMPERRRRRFAGLVADLDARTVVDDGGQRVNLTTAEFDLLTCFLERPGRVLSRDQLLDWTRGRAGGDPFDRTIDVTVSRLRGKLSRCIGEAEQPITTVRNVGYLFSADVREA